MLYILFSLSKDIKSEHLFQRHTVSYRNTGHECQVISICVCVCVGGGGGGGEREREEDSFFKKKIKHNPNLGYRGVLILIG